MQPGQRIAIKSTYTRKKGLPFDNQGRVVSVMAIKATGTITANPGNVRAGRGCLGCAVRAARMVFLHLSADHLGSLSRQGNGASPDRLRVRQAHRKTMTGSCSGGDPSGPRDTLPEVDAEEETEVAIRAAMIPRTSSSMARRALARRGGRWRKRCGLPRT